MTDTDTTRLTPSQQADYRPAGTCPKCNAELSAEGDCPVCDPWPEDEFEDD